MIFETRQIVFSNTALKKAVDWYAKVPNQSDLPLGLITAVVPKPGGGIVVHVHQSGASRLREVPLTPSKTLGVLLFFCRKQRVPIPREAEKDIASQGDGIILTISAKTRTAPPEM